MIAARVVVAVGFVARAGCYNDGLFRKVILVKNDEKLVFGIARPVGKLIIKIYFPLFDQSLVLFSIVRSMECSNLTYHLPRFLLS